MQRAGYPGKAETELGETCRAGWRGPWSSKPAEPREVEKPRSDPGTHPCEGAGRGGRNKMQAGSPLETPRGATQFGNERREVKDRDKVCENPGPVFSTLYWASMASPEL